ncbi:MAG: hypothetical protein GX045_01795 [Clostridiaceae bacterium]|nr:hypothetical protein [Clostridiaceae bacterium]
MANTDIKKSKNIMVLVILLAVLAAGIIIFIISSQPGSNSGNITRTEPSQQASNEPEMPEYYFEYNGVEIAIGAKAAPITEALGEPIHYFEAQSCAFEGMDRIYTYAGFDLQTYTKNDEEYVFSISFLDDTVTTREGIAISDSLDDVIEAYGQDYENSFNQYSYTDNNYKLSFIIEDNEVVSIEYALIVE